MAEWKSDTIAVASISSSGIVDLKTQGTAIVYASYTDNEITRNSPKATLTVTVQEARNNYLYLDISDSSGAQYAKANAAVVAWIWGNGLSSQWYELEAVDSSYMRVEIPIGATGIIFARGQNFYNESTWNGLSPLWNKTGDLTVPTDSKNTFVPSAWDGATSSWKYVDHGDNPEDYIYANIVMEPSEDDTTLSSVCVNGTNLTISSRMVYTIPYDIENAEVEATANYTGATVSITPSSSQSVEIGNYVDFSIKVTAKDGNTETYTIKVKRSGSEPLNSETNKKRCYIEDTEEKTVTLVYDLDTWNDKKDNITSLTIRGSFTTNYNSDTKKWIEDTDTYSLSFDSNYNWYSVTLPYDKIKRPGYSGQPEYKFYRNGMCLEAPSFMQEKYIFKNDDKNMMILYSSDDESRLSELAENSQNAQEIKALSDFDITTENGKKLISNFRKVPGTTQLYRSYHPYYPSHTSTPTDPLCQDRCRLMEGHLYEVYNNI